MNHRKERYSDGTDLQMAWKTSVQKEAWCYETTVRKNQMAAGIRKVEGTAREDWLTEER